MKTYRKFLVLLLPIVWVLSSSVRADVEETDNARIVEADKVIGLEVRTADGKKLSEIKDLAIQLGDGDVLHAHLANGSVVPASSLRWDRDEKWVRLAKSADAKPVSRQKQDAPNAGEYRSLLLSKLNGTPIIGRERTETGYERDKLGTVGGSFIDVNSGSIAFIATSIGGEFLGIGAESRVIPWSAVRPRLDLKSGDWELITTFTERRLEKGPAYGSGPDKIYNPLYRRALYSYYDADRPDFDRMKDGRHIVTLRRVLGAKIMRSDRKIDNVGDLVVDVRAGSYPSVVLSSGMIVDSSALKWDYQEKRFDWMPANGDSKQSSDGAHTVLATKLDDFDIIVDGETYGYLGTIYVDTKDRTLEYITVVVGTTLGLGGEVKVLPWDSVTVIPPGASRSGALRVGLSKDIVKKAPNLDGSAGSDLYDPDFRARVDALIDG